MILGVIQLTVVNAVREIHDKSYNTNSRRSLDTDNLIDMNTDSPADMISCY